jgi:hypothetical protein
MNKNTKLILMTGGAVALAYALMEYYKRNVASDSTPLPQVPENDPMRASSFTAGDDFFANYVTDDFFGFTANEPFMNAGGGFFGKFKKKGRGSNPVGREMPTRCETNLERIARLNPNPDAYQSQLNRAYSKYGGSFNSWAQSTAQPCFVVGIEQGGLQTGSSSFTASENFFNAGGKGLGEILGIKKSSGKSKFAPKSKPFFSKSKGNKETGLADLQFTASENFFNASGVPIATDEPNFKF